MTHGSSNTNNINNINNISSKIKIKAITLECRGVRERLIEREIEDEESLKGVGQGKKAEKKALVLW